LAQAAFNQNGFAGVYGFNATDQISLPDLGVVMTVPFTFPDNENGCLAEVPDPPVVSTEFLAIVIEIDGKKEIDQALLLERTDYDPVNNWVSDQVVMGLPDPDKVTTEDVYAAIERASKNQPLSPPENEGAELFYFGIDINLTASACN
jgi:hypothetical protein